MAKTGNDTDEGAIFGNKNKKGQNDPDFTGSIKLSDTMLKMLISKQQQGEEMRLRVAGWKNQSKDGKSYLRLRLSEDTYMQGAPRQDNQRAQFRSEGYARKDSGTAPANGGYGTSYGNDDPRPNTSGYTAHGKAPWDDL